MHGQQNIKKKPTIQRLTHKLPKFYKCQYNETRSRKFGYKSILRLGTSTYETRRWKQSRSAKRWIMVSILIRPLTVRTLPLHQPRRRRKSQILPRARYVPQNANGSSTNSVTLRITSLHTMTRQLFHITPLCALCTGKGAGRSFHCL